MAHDLTDDLPDDQTDLRDRASLRAHLATGTRARDRPGLRVHLQPAVRLTRSAPHCAERPTRGRGGARTVRACR